MKTKLTLAAGLFASSYAAAALTGTVAWDTSATAYDGAVSNLYSHLSTNGNYYLTPDANENRSGGQTTLGTFLVDGQDTLDIFNLGGTAGASNTFGVRISFGGSTYELGLTPESKTDTVPSHYFGKVSDYLVLAGGPAISLGEIATLDFFIINNDAGKTIYSSQVHPDGGLNPMFNFTPELLAPGGFDAVPLDAVANASAISLLADEGFQVWGFEDRNVIDGVLPKLEPDFNDRIFAFRIVPVPEPSTYGLLGAVALLGLIAQRRFKMKKA